MQRLISRDMLVSLAGVFLALLISCSSDSSPEVSTDAGPTPTVAAAVPTATTVPPTVPPATPTPAPTATPTPAPTATPVPPRTPAVGIQVTDAPFTGPQSSSAIATTADGSMVVTVNPDSDSVSIVDSSSLKVLAEVTVGDDPRTLAITPDGSHAIVANHAERSVSAVDLSSFEEVALWPIGAMPYGVVTDGILAYVSEFGTGSLRAIQLSSGRTINSIDIGAFPTGLALDGNGSRIMATHLFDGDVTFVDAKQFDVLDTISTGSDNNVSQTIVISPEGDRAFVPQTRSNVTSMTLLFDATVFPVVNVVNLVEPGLVSRERITLDTADIPVNTPFDVAITPDGAHAYVVNAGSDRISVIDLETNRGVAGLAVGSNPRGIAMAPDGSRAYVANVLDGTVSVIDTGELVVTDTIEVTDIPLEPDILLGKKIFNSAADPVLSTDGWISCASCHFDGGSDQRTWLGFPDGPRNTPPLFGVGETLPVHWSGDLDELADVELTIRNIQTGTGLVEGDELDSLGPPHAGLSEELDALAAYMDSLEPLPASHGTDAATFEAGSAVFQAQGCAECHIPGTFVDGKIHDVGTGDPALEKNSHGRGTSFDTPSLRSLWVSAPYMHDGSAPTLRDVLRAGDAHNVAGGLSDAEIDDLVGYLMALPEGSPPNTPAGSPGYNCPGETNREEQQLPWC